jgi:hypothetical protein
VSIALVVTAIVVRAAFPDVVIPVVMFVTLIALVAALDSLRRRRRAKRVMMACTATAAGCSTRTKRPAGIASGFVSSVRAITQGASKHGR